jgi:nicotinate-nucleotide adenylyltransferase
VSVGLLGGAFDPPHVGHVALAQAALRELELERLVVVVTGRPPHKRVDTDAETRLRLAEAAFGRLPRVGVSRHELGREGPSYTVETARWAGDTFDDPIFIVGADEFADFLSWRDPQRLLEHVRLAVAGRPGYSTGRLDAVKARLDRPEAVAYFELEPISVSSREIRRRISAGEPIDGLVPPAVARLIGDLGLYRSA